MPGLTLCGEFTNWVGDGNLLNCCVENHDEPLDDDFETRMYAAAGEAWVNPQEVEERSHAFGHYNDEDDADDRDDHSGIETAAFMPPHRKLPFSRLEGLPRPPVKEPADYMTPMLEALAEAPQELVSASSVTRLPLRRSTRYRRH